MDDKVLEERIESLLGKKLSTMSFLESLCYKSMGIIVRDACWDVYDVYKEDLIALIKLLIQAEEKVNELIKSFYPKSDISNFNNDSDIKLHELDLISPSLIDIYVEFDKKLNAKIEEVLN